MRKISNRRIKWIHKVVRCDWGMYWHILVHHASFSLGPWEAVPPRPEVLKPCSLRTTPTNPWLTDGWFKEFKSVFNLWVTSRRRQLSPRKLPGFLVGTWTLALAADCLLGWAGISSGYPRWCDRESPVTKRPSAHWCPLGSTALPFADGSPLLSAPTRAHCWDGSSHSVVLLVLSAQRTPT